MFDGYYYNCYPYNNAHFHNKKSLLDHFHFIQLFIYISNLFIKYNLIAIEILLFSPFF